MRYSISTTARVFIGISALVTALCGFSRVHAAPVTFRFEAEVTNAFSGVPFDLPLQYDVGDTIHGSMTFEPVATTTLIDDPTATVQPFLLEFEFNGSVIGTSVYGLKVLDNGAIIDSPWPGDPVFDILTAESSIGPNPHFPPSNPAIITLSNGDSFHLGVRIGLIGEQNSIAAQEIVSSALQLNSFDLQRILNLTFAAADGSGAMGLQANIKTFTAIPELPSLIPLSVCLGILAVSRKW